MLGVMHNVMHLSVCEVGRTMLTLLWIKSKGMLAAVQAAAPELSRGVSTALAIFSLPRCPDCHCHPSLQCNQHECPSCVCNGQQRECPSAASSHSWTLLCSVFITGFALGAGVWHWLCNRYLVTGTPSSPCSQTTEVDDRVQARAHQQLQELRSRRLKDV